MPGLAGIWTGICILHELTFNTFYLFKLDLACLLMVYKGGKYVCKIKEVFTMLSRCFSW